MIGVIALFTEPVADDTEVVMDGLVINVWVVTDGPVPAELVAVTDAVYCVPGWSPLTFDVVVFEVTTTVIPEFTGVTVTV